MGNKGFSVFDGKVPRRKKKLTRVSRKVKNLKVLICILGKKEGCHCYPSHFSSHIITKQDLPERYFNPAFPMQTPRIEGTVGLLFFFCGARIEPRASRKLSKCSTTERHPVHTKTFLDIQWMAMLISLEWKINVIHDVYMCTKYACVNYRYTLCVCMCTCVHIHIHILSSRTQLADHQKKGIQERVWKTKTVAAHNDLVQSLARKKWEGTGIRGALPTAWGRRLPTCHSLGQDLGFTVSNI